MGSRVEVERPTLSGEGVEVRIGGRTLLSGVDISVAPGEIVAVAGPNGAGKSTLLRVLAGDLEPSAGTVRLAGRPLAEHGAAAQARLRAVVGQAPLLAFDYSAADVVEMGWLGRPGPACLRVLQQTMAALGVDHLADRAFSSLSGGEQQRVQFARALVQIWRSAEGPGAGTEPRWLLLDEPTANLDLAHALALLALARQHTGTGIGVLVVLHDLNLAARFADRVLLLEQGRCVAAGPPACVLEPARLTRVYGTPVHVEHHPLLNRLVVLS